MLFRRKNPPHPLDDTLFGWNPPLEPYRVRDLLNGGALVLGRAGSGKTNSSGRLLGQSIMSHPRSAGLILAAKPEDCDMWKAVAAQAGRLDDLIVLDAAGPHRCNYLSDLGQAQAMNVVQVLLMIGQALKRGEGHGENDQFWETFKAGILYNAVVPAQTAGDPLEPWRLHSFIKFAANAPAELGTPAWEEGYHARVLKQVEQTALPPLAEHGFRLAKDFWLKEYPAMDPKLRSNGLAGVRNILYTFNAGIVREMVGGATNCSPDDILLNGWWVLVNFPVSTWHAVGAFISTGWKYLTELAILQRRAADDSPFCCIRSDESSTTCNQFDADFICQARSR
jgi:hypothetical protein